MIRAICKNVFAALRAFWAMPAMYKLMIVAVALVIAVPFKFVYWIAIYQHINFAAPFLPAPWANKIMLVGHIITAVPPLVLGPFLFYRPLRDKRPAIHRLMGKIYVGMCLISALLVFPLALHNSPGTIAPLGFGVMTLVWFTTTFLAYGAAINKDFVAHRRWMIRSYAVTFAFVHVNLTYKLILPPYDTMSRDTIKALQSMASWQFNLLVMELYLCATSFAGRFVGWKKFGKNLISLSRDDRMYIGLNLNFRNASA